MNNEIQKAPAAQLTPRGFEFPTIGSALTFATEVHNSGLAPDGFKSPSAVLVAMQMGGELGLRPMASIQTICVINGRPCIWGDGLWAVCQASPLFDQEELEEGISPDKQSATCTVARVGGKPITRKFSMEDAKAAGLLTKDNWKKYPRRMLQMRARMWACRDAFADVLCGMVTVEEVVDDALGRPDGPSAEAREHIEHIKAAKSTESPQMEPMRQIHREDELTKQMTKPHAAADPPPNPPTPEEVAAAGDAAIVHTNHGNFPGGKIERHPIDAAPTPSQITNAEELVIRIDNVVTAGNVVQLETDLAKCLRDGLIAKRDHGLILELLDNAKLKLSKV